MASDDDIERKLRELADLDLPDRIEEIKALRALMLVDEELRRLTRLARGDSGKLPQPIEDSRPVAQNTSSTSDQLAKGGREFFERAPQPERGRFWGLGIGPAAVQVLGERGEAMTEIAISEALIASGFKTDAEKPELSVAKALRDIARKDKNLFRTDSSTWAFRSWYSPTEVKRLLTARGLRNAKERGVVLGRPFANSQRDILKFRECRAAGMNVKMALKEAGIGKSTYYKYRNLFDGTAERDSSTPVADEPRLKLVT